MGVNFIRFGVRIFTLQTLLLPILKLPQNKNYEFF
jgi:hypothetical protein